jgi:predicted ATPase
MLTRLKVSGFKNLVDTDVYFGPFTCIAGVNGVGKSNLFDAITFLSALADRPLLDAARCIRDEEGRSADIRNLFHRVGEQYAKEMTFLAEMILPAEGVDDLGQRAEASITFVCYELTLRYRGNENVSSTVGPLEIVAESLTHINITDAYSHLPFPHNIKWRKGAIKGRRSVPFISTTNDAVLLHQESKGIGGGRPFPRFASTLPRTVLSVVNAAESPTAFLTRSEMRSWRMLQLEPTALRQPDDFLAPRQMGTDGSHLATTLYHLAHANGDEAAVYSKVANRLAELLGDVRSVEVDRDERREVFTAVVTGKDGTPHPARALSDGTLRFLALSVLALDTSAQGVLCMEEPENGIHPARIPAMLQLLRDIAVDAEEPVGPDNPLRQVIINTHSPTVVANVAADDLLVAYPREVVNEGNRYQRVCFSPLNQTWRAEMKSEEPIRRSLLISYLDPLGRALPPDTYDLYTSNGARKRRLRVMDQPDLQPMIPGLVTP